MNEQMTFGQTVEFGEEVGPVFATPTYDQVYAFLQFRDQRAPATENRFLNAETARAQGFAGPIVPGTLLETYLSKLLTDWCSPLGSLDNINVNFRRSALHDEELRCYGLVTDTREEDDDTVVKLDVFLEKIDGDRPIQGVAEVRLPARPS